jgi:hypothetical protein
MKTTFRKFVSFEKFDELISNDEVLNNEELVAISGGLSAYELIMALFEATPAGSNMTFTNNNGEWVGSMSPSALSGMHPNSNGGGGGGVGGGGFTLPGVTVTAGSIIYQNHIWGSNYSSYDMVMGHAGALQWAQNWSNGIGSYANYLLSGLASAIPGLNAFGFFNGLFQTGVSQSLQNIIAGIQASQGNIVITVQHISGGVPGTSFTSYTITNVNTGNILGSFSFPG